MKTFMMTTAVALALSTTAYAQSMPAEYMEGAAPESVMASNLLGARIYATETEGEIVYSAGMETEWDDIGEINDVIVSRDGRVEGVVLGVGGFLGMGEKDVAVSMDQLQFISDGEAMDEWFIVVNTTAEALEAAPTFERMEMAEVDAQATGLAEDRMGVETAEAGDGVTTMEAMDGETEVATTTLDADTEIENETPEAVAVIDGETMEAEGEQMAAEVEQMGEAATAEVEAMAAATGAAIGEAGDRIEAEGEEFAANMEETTDATVTQVETELAEAETAIEGEMVEAETEMAAAMDATPEIEGFTRVDISSISQEDLMGAEVFGRTNEEIGEVGEIVNDGAIIEVGGFLGLGEKNVLMPLDQLAVMAGDDGEVRIYVDATEEMLEEMPEYEVN